MDIKIIYHSEACRGSSLYTLGGPRLWVEKTANWSPKILIAKILLPQRSFIVVPEGRPSIERRVHKTEVVLSYGSLKFTPCPIWSDLTHSGDAPHHQWVTSGHPTCECLIGEGRACWKTSPGYLQHQSMTICRSSGLLCSI